MATSAQTSGGGFTATAVLLLLLLGLAAGGGKGLEFSGGGGGSESRSVSTPENPCEGKGKDHVVKRWLAPGRGLIRMRCGDESIGYRKHVARGRSWGKEVKDCIGRVLQSEPRPGRPPNEGLDIYGYTYAGKKGVEIAVIRKTGDVVSAYLVRGGSWADCAKGGA